MKMEPDETIGYRNEDNIRIKFSWQVVMKRAY